MYLATDHIDSTYSQEIAIMVWLLTGSYWWPLPVCIYEIKKQINKNKIDDKLCSV